MRQNWRQAGSDLADGRGRLPPAGNSKSSFDLKYLSCPRGKSAWCSFRQQRQTLVCYGTCFCWLPILAIGLRQQGPDMNGWPRVSPLRPGGHAEGSQSLLTRGFQPLLPLPGRGKNPGAEKMHWLCNRTLDLRTRSLDGPTFVLYCIGNA
jgi:hypothetical protein